jgi:hypothetical protein
MRSLSLSPFPLRRRAWLLAVAAVVLVVVGVLLASSHRGASRAPGSRARVTRARRDEREPSPQGTALQFADTYLEFLYGRSSPTTVAPVRNALRARLGAGRSLATPAELSRQLSVRDLHATPTGPHTAAARAVVDDGVSPPYTLSFDLRLIAGRWLVSGVGGGQ